MLAQEFFCEHYRYHCPTCEMKFLKIVIEELEQQNKQLIVALEYYGNHDNHCRQNVCITGSDPSWIEEDKGKCARDALQQIQGNQEP